MGKLIKLPEFKPKKNTKSKCDHLKSKTLNLISVFFYFLALEKSCLPFDAHIFIHSTPKASSLLRNIDFNSLQENRKHSLPLFNTNRQSIADKKALSKS